MRRYTTAKKRNVIALYLAGWSQAAIARKKRLDPSTVSRWIREAELVSPSSETARTTDPEEEVVDRSSPSS